MVTFEGYTMHHLENIKFTASVCVQSYIDLRRAAGFCSPFPPHSNPGYPVQFVPSYWPG